MKKKNAGDVTRSAQEIAKTKRARRLRRIAKRKELIAAKTKGLIRHIDMLTRLLDEKERETAPTGQEASC